MDKTDSVEHIGVVSEISNDSVTIVFQSQSACASCHANGFCTSNDVKQREVTVKNSDSMYTLGEQVRVKLSASKGLRAVLLSYFIPFVILILVLLLGNKHIKSEPKLAGIALASVILWYCILYLFRNSIEKKFVANINKL